MRNQFTVLVALALALMAVVDVSAGVGTPATERSIKELMALTGAGNLSVQRMEEMLPALKLVHPQVPKHMWTDFLKEVDPNELIDLLIPVYAKHYSEEEIQETIKFYRSPAGVALLQKQPLVIQESHVVGQQWGRSLTERVIEKAKKVQSEAK